MKTLRLNDSGDDVLKLTNALHDLALLDAPGSVFDKKVQNAVKQFQASHTDPQDRPLDVDGVVGPVTWWALTNQDLTDVKFPTGVSDHVLASHSPSGSSFHDVLIDVAVGEMNAKACEIGANNSGPFVEKYLNGLAGTPNNWCSGFVSYCHKKASEVLGIPMPYKYSLGAKDTYKQFQKKGWTYAASDSNPPLPGSIIVWHRGDPRDWTGHIGLVYSYANGIVKTIEGNKGAYPCPVRVFTYTLGKIDKLYGFGRVQL